MPAFLHFYGGYTDKTYKRIPRGKWLQMVQYMNEYMERMMSGR